MIFWLILNDSSVEEFPLNALIFSLILNTENNDRAWFLEIGKWLEIKLIIINLNEYVNNYRR